MGPSPWANTPTLGALLDKGPNDSPKKPEALNARQRLFVREYLVDFNGKQAAIRAGYSRNSAETQASDLLALPKVSEAVAEAIARREARVDVKADDVLRGLMRIAGADLRQMVDEEGNALKLHELPEELALALAGVDVEELWAGSGDDRHVIGDVVKYRLNDRMKAWELLGKHLGMFTEKVEVSGSFAEHVMAAAARRKGNVGE